MGGAMVRIPSDHAPDSFWARATFTSPSVRYASDPVYAKPIDCGLAPPNHQLRLQIVLQVRQLPGLPASCV